jgi:hypothetical protein
VKRASIVVLSVALLCACSASDSAPTTTTYPWTATPEQAHAVGIAREMDAQIAGVWATYSDGLLLHHMYDFCEGLDAAPDVAQYLDETAEAQGEAVLLPLVVGSPFLCPERSDVVGDWIAEQAANE